MGERWRIREGWSVLLLSFALAMVASVAIASAGWTEGLRVVPIASLGAFIIGLMIAKSILPGWTGHLFSLIIGFAWAFWLTARMFPESYTWYYRWAWTWYYIYQWFVALFTGAESHNNLVFVLQMALIVWGITYLSVWFIFRVHRVWHAIVPGGILLLANMIYSPNDITIYMLVYLALALLLVIRHNLFTQEQIWRREWVHFNSDEISFDFLRAGALFTVVILALAWVTPGVVSTQDTEVFDALRAPWHDLQAEWNRLFASLNYRPTAGVDFYGQKLNLGGPRDLAEIPVLEIDAPPEARYWRAVVFDKFTGRGWENTDNTLVPFGADNNVLPMVDYRARRMITHTATLLGPSMSMLPMAAQPLWLDQPTRASVSFVSVPIDYAVGGLEEAGSTVQQIDTVSYTRSRVPLDAGDTYVAASLLTQAPISWLERAGTNYPTWVTERYLQLPDTVPDRVVQLAEEIAAPYDTPYEKASAIEGYLRSEIAYNEKIEAPPPDRDPVDYILFDLRQAYCDYYATSMAVMLRSLDIPSRIVSGYAQGHYDPERDAFEVLLQDAHTWVEVYFPNYGWVEFEPTAAQPVIIRPIEPNNGDSLAPDSNQDPDISDLDRMDRMEELLDEELPPESDDVTTPLWSQLAPAKPGSWIFGGLVLVTLAGVTVWLMRNQRQVRLTNVGSIYHNMLRLAGWAGASTYVSQTPYEHASALSQVVPEGERPAKRIAGLYARERYGHKSANDDEQTSAQQAWLELRPKLVRTTIMRRLKRRPRT
jgi:transglutaminase-like putative cysteine protease